MEIKIRNKDVLSLCFQNQFKILICVAQLKVEFLVLLSTSQAKMRTLKQNSASQCSYKEFHMLFNWWYITCDYIGSSCWQDFKWFFRSICLVLHSQIGLLNYKQIWQKVTDSILTIFWHHLIVTELLCFTKWRGSTILLQTHCQQKTAMKRTIADTHLTSQHHHRCSLNQMLKHTVGGHPVWTAVSPPWLCCRAHIRHALRSTAEACSRR